MKTLRFSSLIFIAVILLASCGDDPVVSSDPNLNCEFVDDPNTMDGAIDDEERRIMTECRESELRSPEEITANLIGTWDLIGFGHGWFWTVPQPCSQIVFEEDMLTLRVIDSWRDTTITTGWEILLSTNGSPYISYDEDTPSEGLRFRTFCDNYIFYDSTPVDGNMYLYEKVD